MNSWNEKKVFVTGLVQKRSIKRRRKEILERKTTNVKKKKGHDYFLTSQNGERRKVCRVFFLNTLNLGEDSMKRWIESENDENYSDFHSSSEDIENPSIKRKALSRKVIERELLIDNVKSWLDLIPKVPSHYCRASSCKQYVDNSFKSKNNMYKIFKDWCDQNNKKPLHLKLFKTILNDFKIGIHKPRKDQCDVCYAFKVKNICQDVYDAHILRKNEARLAKTNMKASANNQRLIVTIDLQSILTCPKLLASQSYYKLKLQVHNFTIYSLNDRKVTLYVWHEANGGVTCNEFTSCLIDYLQDIPDNYKTVVLISDGCNYQNRNKTLASALSDFCKFKNITVQQLYLEKGHTMMEADAVHSTLEQYFNPPINSPTDYIARMRMARKNQPYKIKSLDFSFFKKYELLSNFASIRPGKKAGDPVVVDIRQLKYLSTGEVFYTLDYSDNWTVIPSRRENQEIQSYITLYKKPIPISDDKFKHLQDLKMFIEKDHHAFYDALPHEKKKKK